MILQFSTISLSHSLSCIPYPLCTRHFWEEQYRRDLLSAIQMIDRRRCSDLIQNRHREMRDNNTLRAPLQRIVHAVARIDNTNYLEVTLLSLSLSFSFPLFLSPFMSLSLSFSLSLSLSPSLSPSLSFSLSLSVSLCKTFPPNNLVCSFDTLVFYIALHLIRLYYLYTIILIYDNTSIKINILLSYCHQQYNLRPITPPYAMPTYLHDIPLSERFLVFAGTYIIVISFLFIYYILHMTY
jgi:hypothetical protein